MIEKTIHYCWFGGKSKPKSAIKCINSWKKYCPDYKIVEWNENTFDLNCNAYVKEAYENKKWAFITDYVRLFAIYNFGGIYMDTDVEVLKPLDQFLDCDGFTGFQSMDDMVTGIMAGAKGSKMYKALLDYYTDKHFVNPDGSLDLTTNTETITKMFLEMGFKPNNQFQEIDGFRLYPNEYFCPKDSVTLEVNITENSYAIHHFAGTWVPHSGFRKFLKKLLGPKLARKISKKKRNK